MVVGPGFFREAVTTFLAHETNVAILGAVPLAQAVTAVRDTSPDIVVMEVAPQGDGALTVLRTLARLRPTVRAVLVCNYCSRDRIKAAIDAGAHACISGEGGSAKLIDAIDVVRRGRHYLGPWIVAKMGDGHLLPLQQMRGPRRSQLV